MRRTGPVRAVVVFECRTHGCYFTAYVPGWRPYQRSPWVHVAPDGQPLVRAPKVARFDGTRFAAAVDAAAGLAWNRGQGDDHRGPWWQSQWRELEDAQRLVGVAPALGERRRDLVSTALGVDGIVLRDAAAEVNAAPGYRSRGKAVTKVLERLPEAPCVVDRLAAAGYAAGLWARPLRWDPAARRLRAPAFLAPGTADPP